MLNPTDIFTVSPVTKVTPASPMTVIADPAGELEFRLALFSQGEQYQGKIVSRIDDQTFLVTVGGTSVKMALGTEAQIGQTISLRFMGNYPSPSFSLVQTASNQSSSAAFLSNTAQLIDQYLQNTEQKKASATFEAKVPITNSPNNPPQIIANDLRHALMVSGLFYESHLAEHVEGKRQLSVILQEPQNQLAVTPSALVPQQLNILENQRLVWHGEAWPDQLMEWEVWRKDTTGSVADRGQQSSHEDAQNESIASKITLHLPSLGSVTAELNLQNGKMHIQFYAEDQVTVSTLKNQSPSLMNAIEKSGQSLDYLSVTHHEPSA